MLDGCRKQLFISIPATSFCMNNRSCPKDVVAVRCMIPLASMAEWDERGGKKKKKWLTVLMSLQSPRWAAGAVSRCSEAQHRGEILGELLQACHVSHMDAVLEVRSYCYHGNVLFFARFPGQQLLKKKNQGKDNRRENYSDDQRLWGSVGLVCF